MQMDSFKNGLLSRTADFQERLWTLKKRMEEKQNRLKPVNSS